MSLPEGAPGWCYLADGEPVWLARPRWDGFGYEVRQYRAPSSPFVGSRMLATTIEGARALLPRGLVVETSMHPAGGLALHAYRGGDS